MSRVAYFQKILSIFLHFLSNFQCFSWIEICWVPCEMSLKTLHKKISEQLAILMINYISILMPTDFVFVVHKLANRVIFMKEIITNMPKGESENWCNKVNWVFLTFLLPGFSLTFPLHNPFIFIEIQIIFLSILSQLHHKPIEWLHLKYFEQCWLQGILTNR